MLEIYVYGDLRRYAPESRPDRESVMRLASQPGETVGTVLERLGIPPAEVCHIFLNGGLLVTRNGMAPWLDYPQATGGAGGDSGGMDTPVQGGDRLGLFAHDMALLVV
jgi:hypothetical protein